MLPARSLSRQHGRQQHRLGLRLSEPSAYVRFTARPLLPLPPLYQLGVPIPPKYLQGAMKLESARNPSRIPSVIAICVRASCLPPRRLSRTTPRAGEHAPLPSTACPPDRAPAP
ncbi:uncharacterized protein TRAVEDRAFT_56199, partial [Trametes versicolor FP-101664 SS1]|uniref:uncharacterized protein n=1 Tax=Trametes versicolor (strain FP-101664) TaxID=717944 RepID=UPI00046225B7